ncbi:MAG: DNA ligase [Sinimarinibacterium flocculans]|uniref:DNA ligase n=1 Tax=Sinimarinibacterium flocculans TaxID=985250 RepID=UPI003C435D2B
MRSVRKGLRAATLLAVLLVMSPSAPAGEPAPPPLMLAQRYEAGVDVRDYWISEKLDGVRGYWDGSRLLTRGGRRIRTPDWYTAGWPHVPLDGELWIGRGRFDEVSGIVRRQQPEDGAWQRVRYMVFDLPAHPGTFDERLAALRDLTDRLRIDWLQPVAQFRLDSPAALEARLADILSVGGEGLMLHRAAALRQVRRGEDLLKLKAHDDAEAQVIGHEPGQGRYRGMLGALRVRAADGREFRLGTGFTDAQRRSPPAPGTWVTYRYNGLTSTGLPRFARFLRVRDEMPPPDPP